MGTPPEDDAGASEGAPVTSIDPASATSDRRSALAARIDAALAGGHDDEPRPPRIATDPVDTALDVDDLEEVEDPEDPIDATAPAPRVTASRPAIAAPPLPPRGRPVIAIPPRGAPATPPKPPAIPAPRPPGHGGGPSGVGVTVAAPPVVAIPPPIVIDPPRGKPSTDPPPLPRPRPPSTPPTPPGESGRMRRASPAPPTAEEILADAPDITDSEMLGGVEVSTATPNIVVDQPLEAHLESPTVIDQAIAALGDAGSEARAEQITRELDATLLDDPAAAAFIAYELGELYERRLADEARAVKAFGRAINLDPSLRPNLWAIRRVFYRRALWPNLAKLVDAEVEYARDDHERADLLLEKARVVGYQMGDLDAARTALDEAVRIAPQHQGALLELERVVAKQGDSAALLDVWERLAEAVALPARKIAYWLEVGRAAGKHKEIARAQEAFDKASALASGGHAAERVARERLRVADEHGSPDDVAAAIDQVAQILLAQFGPAGPGASDPGAAPVDHRLDRAAALRLELVALRRRQAQLVRGSDPDRAWDTLQQALALSPGESLVLADLTELAEELGRYEDLAELVQSWQAVEGDPARAMVLSIRRADALLRGGRRDQARALLASLEASAPGFVVLTSAAEREALGRADPADLAKVYLAAAHAALLGTWLGPGQPTESAPAAAAALYIQAAELLAYHVATPEAVDEARAALAKALEAVSDHPVAFEASIELDDSHDRVGEALARLRFAAETATSDTRRGLLDRATRLARSHGDIDMVATIEGELAALAPNDLALLWRLESTLAQLGRDDDRAALLVRIAGAETDETRRGTALAAAARLRERAGAVEQATELYRQVLALWPTDTFARESLVDLLRAQERWPELIAERRAEAKALPDGPAARRALREAAWLVEVRLEDARTAAEVYADWLARSPDDRTALEGAARCRARAGDHAGEVAARRAITMLDDGSGSAEDHWLLARAHERAGDHDAAADLYRRLMLRDEPSVAATGAAIALADLAAARADTVMRVEATAALAGRTADPKLAATLAEDSGWMYALALDDFDRAALSFAAAIALEPDRRGALFGAALVASKRGETAALAVAYETLAGAVAPQMPEAAASLLMRAGAIAAASGDLDLANQRVAAARTAAPDDIAALLVVAETGTTPTVEAGDAFGAVDPLLARAEILELRAALADDAAARMSWELDRAEALELAGRLREAGAVVAAVLKTRPDELRALSALRRMALRAGDKATSAQASYALARQLGDRTAKLELLRAAAAVFDGPGLSHNTDYALATYKRILQVDPGAAEHDRLLELLRERADARALVASISDRLSWLDADAGLRAQAAPSRTGDGDPAIRLLLERATVLHGLGDAPAAMTDLDALLGRAPDHLEALRFRADLAITAGDTTHAVALWRRYLAIETRAPRRNAVELQLAQVLAENTGDIVGAIEQMARVVEATPDDAALRERLLGLCLRTGDWDRAAGELRALARMRPSPQEKAREELRLGLMLRDRLGDRTSARLALDRARTLDPLNLDVVRELADLLEPAARAQALLATATSFRTAIAQSPSRAMLYERLAQVNAWQADVDARWVALVAVEALGTPSIDQRQVLAQGRHTSSAPDKRKLDDAARAALRGALAGPLVELWRAIAPAVQVATGVDPQKLAFARGDKVAQKKLGDKYAPLAAALASFGIDNVELYISASRAGIARALAAETPILCLGADVAAAAMPQHRFQLGRTIATIAEGVATLPELRDGELEWTIVAALRAVDAPIPAALAERVGGHDTAIAERAKILKKELSRKAKQVVQQLAQTKAAELAAIDELRRAANEAAHRAGLLWCGDLAIALAQLDFGRGGRAIADSAQALELVAWSVSEAHLTLRAQVGVALGGSR